MPPLPKGAVYDHARGQAVVDWINNLTHTHGSGAGHGFNLRGWQAEIIRRFYGTIDPKTGLRWYRTLYIEIPRKNGKSELVAALAIYHLIGDGEMGAKVYGAAYDRGQARVIFDVAAQMVRNDPELLRRIKVTSSRSTMGHLRSASVYQAISKESANKHGLNASAILIDEYHTFENNELFTVLTTSQSARSQPVRIIITTAGEMKRKGKITPAYERHRYAEKVMKDPDIDPTFLPIIFCADKDDDPFAKETWKKANPALYDFKKDDGIRELVREAMEIPSSLLALKQLELNIWHEGDGLKAIPEELWAKNKGSFKAGRSLPEHLLGREAYGGLDLASVSDIAALVLVFPPDRGEDGQFLECFDIFCKFWIPEAALERRAADDARYRQWVDAGYLTVTPGNVTDYDFIRAEIMGKHPQGYGRRQGGLVEQVRIKEIAYDPWNATHLVNDLVGDGATMVEFRQGTKSFNPPIGLMEKLLAEAMIGHGGNPVLAWMADNLVYRTDANLNKAPDKKSSPEKIDGMVAKLMALGRWMANNQPKAKSRWENPGGMLNPTEADIAAELANKEKGAF